MPLFTEEQSYDYLGGQSNTTKVDKPSTGMSPKSEKIFASINTQVTNESDFSRRSVILLEKIYESIDKMNSERGIPFLMHRSALAKKEKREVKQKDSKLLKATKESKALPKSEAVPVDKQAPAKKPKDDESDTKSKPKDGEKESKGFISNIKNKISSSVSKIEDFDGDSDNSVKNTVHKIVSVIAPELTLIPSFVTGIKDTVEGTKDKLADAKEATKQHLKLIGIGRKKEEEEKKEKKKQSKSNKQAESKKPKSEVVVPQKPKKEKPTKIEKDSVERSEKQLRDQISNTEFTQERMFPIMKVKESKLKEIDKTTEKILKASEGGGLFGGEDDGGPDIDIDRKKKGKKGRKGGRRGSKGSRIKGGGKGGMLKNIASKGGMLTGLGGAMTGGLGFSGLMGSSMGGIGAAGAGAMATSGAMVAGAGVAGYAVGTGLNKGMGAISDKLTGGKYKGKGWLGDMAYDKINGDKDKDNDIINQTVNYKDKSSVAKSINDIEEVVKRKKDELWISATDKQMISSGERRIASLKGFLGRKNKESKTKKVEPEQTTTSTVDKLETSAIEKNKIENSLAKTQKTLSTNIGSTTVLPTKPVPAVNTGGTNTDTTKTNPVSSKKEVLGKSSNKKLRQPPGTFNNRPDDYKLVFVLTGGY